MRQIAFFFRLWVWFSLRQLVAHRGRAAAVLLGIALGAAVFTSVRLAVNASVDSFSQSMDVITGKADKVVIRPGGRVPEGLVVDLLRHPSVQAASPLMTTYVRSDRPDSDPFLLVGLDPILDRPFRSWQTGGARPNAGNPPDARAEKDPDGRAVSWLDLMSEPRTMLVGRKLLERTDFSPDGRIVLDHGGRRSAFRILGALASEGLAMAEGGEMAIVDIATFQEFTGLGGVVDRIDLLLKPGTSKAALGEIQELLPPGVVLGEPSELKESGRSMIRSYQLNLSVLSFVSLFVGMFLIYSLVALHATSRRHELAILRSLGASSRLIFLLFLAEGAFFGVVGWLAAIPVGSFMVRQMLGVVSKTISHLFVRVRVERLSLDPLEVILSFVLTLSIAVLAAWQPAREAMAAPPREALAMFDACSRQDDSSAGRLGSLGLVLILLVWPLCLLPGLRGVPIPAYLATFFLFCGFSLLSPGCLRLMGSHLPPVLRRIGGQPAYLGARYMSDAGTRIAISVGALITAVALFVALIIMVHSFRTTVEEWVGQTISGDLFLRPKMADINHYRDPLPAEVVSVLENSSTPLDILPYRRIFLSYGEAPYQFEAIDFDVLGRHTKFLFLDGDLDEVLPRLEAGQGVLISEVFSNRTGLVVGGRFRATVEGLEADLPVLGIFRDYRTHGGVVHYSMKHFAERTGDESWSGVRLFLKDRGGDIEARALRLKGEILGECGEWASGIEATVGEDLRREILRIFDETFAVTTVLLVVALLVAAIGIMTTLAVLVLERIRQIHTLMACGASVGQVRAMIFWEAILMVLAGEGLGLACGLVLSRILVHVINRQSFGWSFIYGVDWASILVSFPLILAAALLAALPAGQLALRRPPAMVLRER